MEVVAAAAADFLETSTAMMAVLLVVDGEVDEDDLDGVVAVLLVVGDDEVDDVGVASLPRMPQIFRDFASEKFPPKIPPAARYLSKIFK